MNDIPLKRFALPLWQGAVELIYFAPIWLTFAIYSLPRQQILLWGIMLLLCYCLPRMVAYNRTTLRNGYRILTDIALGMLPVAFLSITATEPQSTLAWIGCSLIGILFVESSFRALMMGWTNSFSATLMLFLLLGAIVAQVVKVAVLHQLSDYNTIYYGLGIAAIVLYLYIQNERTIKDQQMIEDSSITIKRSVRMNRWYISIVALVVVGIASAREIQRIVERYAEQLFATIMAWLFRERDVEEEQSVQDPAPPIQSILDGGPEKEPAKFWLILEMILKWLAIGAIIAVVIMLIVYVLKKLLPIIKQLLIQLFKLKSLQSNNDQGYTDVIEDIKHERHKEKTKRQPRKPGSAMKRWDRLTTTEKVRALYRYVVEDGVRSGKPLGQYLTAVENIDVIKHSENAATSQLYDQLANRYNETRYGMVGQKEEEIQQLRADLEKAYKNKR